MNLPQIHTEKTALWNQKPCETSGSFHVEIEWSTSNNVDENFSMWWGHQDISVLSKMVKFSLSDQEKLPARNNHININYK